MTESSSAAPRRQPRPPAKSARRKTGGVLTLKTSADFQRLARQGRKWTAPSFILQLRKCDEAATPFRIGFTVSRKVGNAVVRNRARRRLREAVRLSLGALALDGFEAVLIAKTPAATEDFAKLRADFERGLAALGAGVRP